MTGVKHTELPFHVTGNHAINVPNQPDYEDYHVCSGKRCLVDMSSKADAEFIVKACNNHYQMLEALKDTCEELEYWNGCLDIADPDIKCLAKVKQAIKDAS